MNKEEKVLESLLDELKGINEVYYNATEEEMSIHKLLKKYRKSKSALKRGIKRLELVDGDGFYILRAGREWAYFDYDRGLNELIKRGRYPNHIYNAGLLWKKFNFEKGLDAIIKKDTTGEYIYKAGLSWKQFDFEKGFEALLRKDKNGLFITLALNEWKKFDYKKALDALIKVDKSGKWIFNAGESNRVLEGGWGEEDYRKAFNHLMNVGDAYFIYTAGSEFWKYFDYKKAFSILKRIDRTGEYATKASIAWSTILGEKNIEEMKEKFPKQMSKAKKNTDPLSFLNRRNRVWSN